jgi:hypothetical protein
MCKIAHELCKTPQELCKTTHEVCKTTHELCKTATEHTSMGVHHDRALVPKKLGQFDEKVCGYLLLCVFVLLGRWGGGVRFLPRRAIGGGGRGSGSSCCRQWAGHRPFARSSNTLLALKICVLQTRISSPLTPQILGHRGGFMDTAGGFMDTGGGFVDTAGGFMDTGGGFMDTAGGFMTSFSRGREAITVSSHNG